MGLSQTRHVMAKRRTDDGLNGFVEWQDHQYDPGHWTGGNRHPIYRRGKGSKRYGYSYIATGVFLVVMILILYLGVATGLIGGNGLWEDLLTMGLLLTGPIILILVGVRYVNIGQEFEGSAARRQRRGTTQRRKRKQQ